MNHWYLRCLSASPSKTEKCPRASPHCILCVCWKCLVVFQLFVAGQLISKHQVWETSGRFISSGNEKSCSTDGKCCIRTETAENLLATHRCYKHNYHLFLSDTSCLESSSKISNYFYSLLRITIVRSVDEFKTRKTKAISLFWGSLGPLKSGCVPSLVAISHPWCRGTLKQQTEGSRTNINWSSRPVALWVWSLTLRWRCQKGGCCPSHGQYWTVLHTLCMTVTTGNHSYLCPSIKVLPMTPKLFKWALCCIDCTQYRSPFEHSSLNIASWIEHLIFFTYRTYFSIFHIYILIEHLILKSPSLWPHFTYLNNTLNTQWGQCITKWPQP